MSVQRLKFSTNVWQKDRTQAELGQKVNLSQSQIAKIENIQQIPDVGTLSGILVALDAQMEIGARKIS
ncbi:helix-turn-helix domain-containing protein [Furfurilactobacillus rossiae]